MHPFGWKPRAKQQFSAGQAILRSSTTIVAKSQHFQPNRARVAGQHRLLSGGLRGGGLYGLPRAEKTTPWHEEKAILGKTDLEQSERERILYRLAEICTSMMRDNKGRVRDVARPLGGILVTPPVDPDYIRRYLGELKGFPKIRTDHNRVRGGAGD